jgi:hypothetical protein
MFPRLARIGFHLSLVFLFTACGEKGADKANPDDSSGLATDSEEPINVTNWDTAAGPVMLISLSEGDSVAIVLPQATDSTLPSGEDSTLLQSDLTVDLFGKAGKVASATVVSPRIRTATTSDCWWWPAGRMKASRSDWRVGFASGRVAGIPLASIEGMSSVDSTTLANSIAQNVGALPTASDPNFRGLPFRVRSAYTFRTDSVEGVVADVIRIVAEEANPRLEHFFIIGERPGRSVANYKIAYFSRSAGAEETAQATELLAVVLIGPARHPVAIVNVEFDEGGKLGLLERTAPGKWQFRWRSAYTGC